MADRQSMMTRMIVRLSALRRLEVDRSSGRYETAPPSRSILRGKGVRVKRSSAVLLSALAMLLAAVPAAMAAPRDRLDVYTGVIQRGDLGAIVELGVDRHELTVSSSKARGKVRVETIISRSQAVRLRQAGVKLRIKRVNGKSVARMSTLQAQDGFEVFRRYSGADGLKEEFEQLADDNRRITKLISIGQTHQGQDIVALKVTKDADVRRDGSKPAALYIAAQHAREWVTPEMVRRLAHHVVDGYSRSNRMRQLLKDTELWFVPVANPDGYDWTFEPDQRLWRKNLRDNNGDGAVSPGDGVDMNRNFEYKWGYDNEGSSPSPPSDTYRGPAPLSEPENAAMDRFVARITPEFFVNYHSAAELLLYGTGWQVATPTPDHVIYEAMAGDDADPAIPNYDPDVSAELYTTKAAPTPT
jgi:Zinc carboxypeptidase